MTIRWIQQDSPGPSCLRGIVWIFLLVASAAWGCDEDNEAGKDAGREAGIEVDGGGEAGVDGGGGDGAGPVAASIQTVTPAGTFYREPAIIVSSTGQILLSIIENPASDSDAAPLWTFSSQDGKTYHGSKLKIPNSWNRGLDPWFARSDKTGELLLVGLAQGKKGLPSKPVVWITKDWGKTWSDPELVPSGGAIDGTKAFYTGGLFYLGYWGMIGTELNTFIQARKGDGTWQEAVGLPLSPGRLGHPRITTSGDGGLLVLPGSGCLAADKVPPTCLKGKPIVLIKTDGLLSKLTKIESNLIYQEAPKKLCGLSATQAAGGADLSAKTLIRDGASGRLHYVWLQTQTYTTNKWLTELRYSRSDDGGKTWSSPKVIDGGESNSSSDCFMPTMAQDSKTKTLSVFYYRRKYPGTEAEVVTRTLQSGGSAWSKGLVVDGGMDLALTMSGKQRLGDCIDATALDGRAWVAYTFPVSGKSGTEAVVKVARIDLL